MRVIIVATIAVLFLTPPVWGVVVVTESGQRVAGYLVKDDGTSITVRERRPDGTDKDHTFIRANVTIIQSVKPDRLAELKPENPRAYRDLAEELAAKKDDPEARDVAIRLLLIAAHLDPDRLGRSSLLAAAPLARDVSEERRFKALAYLLDPKHDRESLKDGPPAASPDPVKDPSWQVFVAALRAYRKGNYAEAVKLANQPGVAKCFAQVPGFVPFKEFVRRCEAPDDPKRPPAPTSDLVRKIVRVELATEEAVSPLPGIDPKAAGPGSPWLPATGPGGRLAPPTLALETLTEFDPRESVFRAGKWQRP